MKYGNMKINFTPERLVEIASLAINGLREDDEDSAMEYFRDTMELTDYEREFFGIPMETDDEEDDEDNYCPSSTNRDYSPSNPWDAPGMSIRDFI